MTSLLNGLSCIRAVFSHNILVRHFYQTKSIRKLGPRPSKKLQAQSESIRARGFLRSVRAYEPPSDASSKVEAICSQAGVSTDPSTLLDDPVIRFNVLKECHSQFNHGIPNSELCHIDTVGDLLTFYTTPVVTVTPYEALKNMDLPKNIYVQPDYIRFHPDTDTMFNGISAFPKSETIITGLRAKEKYKGYKLEVPWGQVAKKI